MDRLEALLKLLAAAVIKPLLAKIRALSDNVWGIFRRGRPSAAPGGEITAGNIRAMQPVYFAAMLDDLRGFEVADKLVALFQSGSLPIGRGDASDMLSTYWRKSASRMSATERRSVYTRTLGVPGGDDGVAPNRDFNELWLRFISSVSLFARQESIDASLRSRVPGAISARDVRKAGRDLAANLALHGSGMVSPISIELQKEIKDLVALLSDAQIRSAYGARDAWQLIDQVATLEFGGAQNGLRYRTMATSGVIVIAWLAKHARRMSASSLDPILNVGEIHNPASKTHAQDAATDPSDWDLVNACEQWLEVTGGEDGSPGTKA